MTVIKGVFHVVGANNKFYANIVFEQNINRLETFEKPILDSLSELYCVQQIRGYLENGMGIILRNCSVNKTSNRFSTYNIDFQYSLTSNGGSWLTESLIFKNFKFSFPNFNDWVQIRSFETKMIADSPTITRIEESNFDSVLYKDKEVKISFRILSVMPWITSEFNISAEQESYILIEYNQVEIGINRFIKDLDLLSSYFTILGGFYCKPQMEILTKADKREFRLLINNSKYHSDSSDNHKINYEINRVHLESNCDFKLHFSKMYNHERKLGTAIDLIAKSFDNSLSSKMVFLNLVYSLDILTGIVDLKPQNKLSTNDIKHLNNLKRYNVPKNTIDYLRAKLIKQSWAKLKDRILLFLQEFDIISINERDLDLIVQKVVNTRNYYSHGNQNLDIYSISELDEINKKLFFWNRTIVLSSLDVPQTILNNLI